MTLTMLVQEARYRAQRVVNTAMTDRSWSSGRSVLDRPADEPWGIDGEVEGVNAETTLTIDSSREALAVLGERPARLLLRKFQEHFYRCGQDYRRGTARSWNQRISARTV